MEQIRKAEKYLPMASMDRQSFRHSAIQISLIYLASWICVYMDLPSPIRLVVLGLMLVLSLQSFENACSVLLLALFMPFYSEFLGFKISGVSTLRIVSLAFLYTAIYHRPKQHFTINKHLFFLFIISFLSIVISAEVRQIIQVTPEHYSPDDPGILNFVARTFDNIVIFLYIYFVFTRLSKKEISNLFDLLLLLALLESASIIFLVIMNPESLMGKQFDEYYLWRNPYFGHKNDWGMVLMIMVLAAYYKRKISSTEKMYYLWVIILGCFAIVFSLSRQSYVSLIIGFIMISLFQADTKPTMYLTIGLILLIFLQPEFFMTRIDTFLNVSSFEDFRGLSRKVGDLAYHQFISNLTIVPRMFFTDWEYNWSEGFWNGLTHQQGILGLLFHIYFYSYLIYRYYVISKTNVFDLSYLSSLMCTSFIIIFIANFNRREINIMHYDGKVRQFGFVLIFLVFFTEYWLQYFKELKSKSYSNDTGQH